MIDEPLHQTQPTFDGCIVYSVVVPVYNSEGMLRELHRRIVAVMEELHEPFEIVFVEDCGRDRSWHVLRDLAGGDLRVTALQLMRNSGQGNATLAGLSRARGAFVITLDDDLQHPPEELPPMIRTLHEDADLDVVIGVPREKQHHFVRRMGSNFINCVNSWFLEKDPKLRFTGFRVMRFQVAKALVAMQVPYPALGPMLISATRRIANVTVRHDPRKEGRSGYTVQRIVKQTLSNFIGYSMLPLRILAMIGAMGVLGSVLLGTYYFTRYFIIGVSVPGWMTLLLLTLAISGFNFFAFSIIGEYILRIMQTSSRTSQCVVRQAVVGGSGRLVVVEEGEASSVAG